MFLTRNATTELSISPVYSNIAEGRFRIHEIDLTDSVSETFAIELDRAAIEFGNYSQQGNRAACSRYENLSDEYDLDDDWSWLIIAMLVQCNLTGGVQNSATHLEELNSRILPEAYNQFSLFPYHANRMLALHYFSLQAYEEAEVEYEKALNRNSALLESAIFENNFLLSDRAEISSLYGDNGMMLSWKLGNEDGKKLLEEAKSRVELAISIGDTLNDSYILGNAYNNMAGVLFVQGENSVTINYMQQAEHHLGLSGDSIGQNLVLGNIGDYYRRWGQLRLAQRAYNKAVSNITNISNVGNNGLLYRKLGDLDLLFLDYESALQNTLNAIAHHDAMGRERSKYESISQLANIYREQGEVSRAISERREVISYFESHDWSASLLMAQMEYSQDLQLNGETESALEISSHVLNKVLSTDSTAGIDRIAIYTNHARILSKLRRSEEAIELLLFGIDELKSSGAEPIDEISLLATLMEQYQLLGRTELAIQAAESAFNLVESQRVEFDSVRLGPMWSARTSNIFASHIEYLLNTSTSDAIERAFIVSERARAASLRQRRHEMMLSMNEGNPAARAEWVEIYSKLQEAKSRQTNEESLLKFERELNSARQKYFAAHGVSDRWEQPSLLESKELLSKLSSDSYFIQFVAGPENLWRFTSDEGEIRVSNLGNKNRIAEAISAATRNILDTNVGRRADIRTLSQLLLGGITFDSSTSNLLISSTSMLDAVPFPALFLDGRYLVDVVSTTMVPSLSEYFSNESVTNDSSRLEIAVLADPAFEDDESTFESAVSIERYRNWSDKRQRLPYSAIEAKELARYFEADERLILTDNLATERKLFSDEVRNARILHIATHGYFNEDVPELVGISVAKEREDDDGFVSLAEISTHRFSSELVVISACDSARGAAMPGEGTMSLSRSFLAQGVNSVVSTLWPISDAATAHFMKEFYHGIKDQNLSAARALQSAQKSLKQHPRYRDPFYWGAYVLTSLSAQSPAS